MIDDDRYDMQLNMIVDSSFLNLINFEVLNLDMLAEVSWQYFNDCSFVRTQSNISIVTFNFFTTNQHIFAT